MPDEQSSYTRIFPQVDFCSCIRCGRVEPPSFVFDDGSFYCYRCLCFMEGGAIYAPTPVGDYFTPNYRYIQYGGKTYQVFGDGTREEVI